MRIVADIGGTQMRMASVSPDGTFGKPVILKTPRRYEDGVELLRKTALSLSNKEPLRALCLGVPGILNTAKEKMVRSPHLPDWEGKPLKHDVRIPLQADVFLENDSALVALGEAHFGAGKGEAIIAYITVSTGVGGARIVNGKIDDYTAGFEPGHQIIFLDKEGGVRELESLVSGTAVAEKYGKSPKEITDPAVWEELAKMLAVGLTNTILHWSPHCLILGGSMFNEVGIPIKRVEHYLRLYIKVFEKLPKIKKGELGGLGGLYGGVAYLNNAYDKK